MQGHLCTCWQLLAALRLFPPLTAILLRTLVPNPIGTTQQSLQQILLTAFPAQFSMRLLLAFAGCLCLLLSLTFRKHTPSLFLARKPNQDTFFSPIKTLTAHAWLSSAKRYPLSFFGESPQVAPDLILAFYRCFWHTNAFLLRYDSCEEPLPSIRDGKVVTGNSRKVQIPTGNTIRLKV